MSYNLFLDDTHGPKDLWGSTKNPDYAVYNWVIVKDYDEFVAYIEEKGIPNQVSFDHNLDEEHEESVGKRKIPYDKFVHKTGYDCILWLIGYCIDNQLTLPKCKVHCKPGSGKNNIEEVIAKFIQYQKDNPISTKK